MPTRTVIDQITDLTKAIGDVYDAVQNGIGDDTSVGSSIYELAQLQSIVNTGVPKFGFVYGLEGEAGNFAVTYDPTDKYYVQVSGGQVSYNGARIQIAPNKVPIKCTLASSYPSDYAYGVLLGFPISEAIKATAVNTTTVSHSVAGGSSVVPVSNVTVATQLGFPLQAQVSGYYLRFSGVNATNDGLVVDPSFYNGTSYGVTPSVTIPSGASIYFIYEPHVMPIYGLPTSVISYSATDYTYYPFMPEDWLPVAYLLAQNPSDPIVSGTAPYEIVRTAVIYPAPESGDTLFSKDMATTISLATVNTRRSLKQAQDGASVSQMLGALEQYTAKIAQDTQTSFIAYWAKQPFKPTSYFAREVSFEGIGRMDFGDAFKRAYFNMRNQDMVRTFAVFRGDLYEFSGVLTGSPPSTVLAHSYSTSTLYGPSANSLLSRGSYVYGVTAITSSGETVPAYVTTRAVSSSPDYFFNHVEWSQVSSALYYHVYRRAKSGTAGDPAALVGDYSEYRLTSDDEVQGYGTFTQANITYATPNQIDNANEAFKITASGTWLQGLTLRMRRGATPVSQSNTVVITIRAHNSGTGKPGAVLTSDLAVIPFSDLTTSWQDFNVLFESGAFALTAGGTYWISISTSASIGSDDIEILTGSQTGTGIYATSPDGTTWTLSNDILPYYRLMYGFVDNGQVGIQTTRRGLKLTGDIALTPKRLRVYVPPVDGLIVGRNPEFQAVSGDFSNFVSDNPESTVTRNELVVTVTARNGVNGTPYVFSVTVPQGTPRDTQFLIGTETDLFDRVDDVQVKPGSALRRGAQNQILWHIYDMVTVETTP